MPLGSVTHKDGERNAIGEHRTDRGRMRRNEHLESAPCRPVARAIYPIAPGIEEHIARPGPFLVGQRIDIHGRSGCLERGDRPERNVQGVGQPFGRRRSHPHTRERTGAGPHDQPGKLG